MDFVYIRVTIINTTVAKTNNMYNGCQDFHCVKTATGVSCGAQTDAMVEALTRG